MQPRSFKRAKELARKEKQQEKAARREERKKEKETRPKPAEGEDPDLAGIIPGPQPVTEQEP
jgi:hypothetical protein